MLASEPVSVIGGGYYDQTGASDSSGGMVGEAVELRSRPVARWRLLFAKLGSKKGTEQSMELFGLRRIFQAAGGNSANERGPRVEVHSLSCSKLMTVREASRFLLLTYLPDLLPPAGFAQLTRVLKAALAELDGGTGTVTLVEHSDLVTARRR